MQRFHALLDGTAAGDDQLDAASNRREVTVVTPGRGKARPEPLSRFDDGDGGSFAEMRAEPSMSSIPPPWIPAPVLSPPAPVGSRDEVFGV